MEVVKLNWLTIVFPTALVVAVISWIVSWKLDNHIYDYHKKSFLTIMFYVCVIISMIGIAFAFVSPVIYFAERADYKLFINQYNAYSQSTDTDTKLYITINAELLDWQTKKLSRGGWSAADDEVLNLPLLGYEE